MLFVYGSLKRGQSNHAELGQAEFVAEARTAARFALRDIDGYPALVLGQRSVRGELFRMPEQAWAGLDAFEGEGYVRGEVELDGGGLAITYFARFPSAGAALEHDQWPM